MKKFLFLLLALVLSVSVSCSDDKTGDTGGSMLSVTPTEIEFEAAGGSRLLDLRTDAGAWSLTQSDNTAWCTPALTSGKTSTSFAVTAIANESSKRSATLTFTAPGCDPVVVTVTQSGDASQDFEGEQVVAQPDAWDNRKRADISYQLLVYSFADGNGDKVGDLPGLTGGSTTSTHSAPRPCGSHRSIRRLRTTVTTCSTTRRSTPPSGRTPT